MPNPSQIERTPRRAASRIVLWAALLAVTGCAGDPPPAPAESYDVRGLVRQIPDPERPGSQLLIYHEPIPDFKDEAGEVVGMEAMTMPFPVAEASLLEGVAAGDKVAFTLEVAWEGSPPIRVSRIEKLPAETRLVFEKPEPDDAPAKEADGD